MAKKMEQIEKLNELFFNAEKKYFDPIDKYLVDGFPNFDRTKISYKAYEKDWFFRTYKEVIFAGLVWTRKLFNVPLTDLKVNYFEHGRKKQWFNVQIVKTNPSIMIDGEKYNPFINISYSYNAVHSIKFEIGFYRFACDNGVVDASQELAKLKISPENLFDIPFWLNPCLLLLLSNRFEYKIKVLKRTSINGEEIRNFVNQKLSQWKIGGHIIDRYIEEMGENGHALLNILTDSATNFNEDESRNPSNEVKLLGDDHLDSSSNSERASRQRKVGQFLEKLIEEIEKKNEIIQKIDINSPEFKISTENIDLLETVVLKEKYHLNISKLKF